MAINVSKPAPRWLRLTKKILSQTSNFVIALLLLLGYTNESLTLLVIKLSESFIMELLDSLMSNGEVYAKADTITKEVTTTQTATVVDATKKDE